MKHTHTPGPWVYGPDIEAVIQGKDVVTQVIQSASSQFNTQPHITHVGGLNQSNEEIEANAARIVKCVNLHDQLLEALDLAERALENVTNDQFKQQALTYIKTVLNKAGG